MIIRLMVPKNFELDAGSPPKWTLLEGAEDIATSEVRATALTIGSSVFTGNVSSLIF